jgi:hypothetical protein
MADALGDRVGDRRRQPRGDRHAQERTVDALAVRQPETHVRGTAGRIDLELVAQPAEDVEHLAAGAGQRPDRHQQRVDHDVLAWDAMVGGPFDDPFGDGEADIGIHADARLVVADRHDRAAVLLDQRQDPLEPLLLAGHAVEQRLALVDREAGLERLDDRRVDRQGHVGQRLHELDRVGQDRRLVRQRDTRVDVEHVRTGFDLGDRVALDPREVAGLHLLHQDLAAGRVDALADDDERLVVADDDLAGGGADDRPGHVSRGATSARSSLATDLPGVSS